MTPADLRDACRDAITRWEAAGPLRAKAPFVRLVIDQATPPRGERMRLFGRSGPTGEILCCPSEGRYTCLFSARAVLAYLAKAALLALLLAAPGYARGHGIGGARQPAAFSVPSAITTQTIPIVAVEVLGEPMMRRVRLSQLWRDERGRYFRIELRKTAGRWVAVFVEVEK